MASRVPSLEYGDDGGRGVRDGDGPVPDRVAGALLPDDGFGRGGRGSGPGDLSSGVAFVRRLRRPFVDADLAVPDRDQCLPDRDRTAWPAPAAVRVGRAGRGRGGSAGAG